MIDFALLVWLASATLLLLAAVGTVGARRRARDPVVVRATARTGPRSARRENE